MSQAITVEVARKAFKAVAGAKIVAFNPAFARAAGSTTAGIMLSQALFYSEHFSDADNWFSKSRQEWEDDTSLSRHEQQTAMAKLKKKAFIKTELHGVPATLCYRVDWDLVMAEVSSLPKSGKLVSDPPKSAGIEQSSLPESGKLVFRKAVNLHSSRDKERKLLDGEQAAEDAVKANHQGEGAETG